MFGSLNVWVSDDHCILKPEINFPEALSKLLICKLTFSICQILNFFEREKFVFIHKHEVYIYVTERAEVDNDH